MSMQEINTNLFYAQRIIHKYILYKSERKFVITKRNNLRVKIAPHCSICDGATKFFCRATLLQNILPIVNHLNSYQGLLQAKCLHLVYCYSLLYLL